MTRNAVALLTFFTVAIGLSACSSKQTPPRLTNGSNITIERVESCLGEYICVYATPEIRESTDEQVMAADQEFQLEYQIIDPDAGANINRPDLDVLKTLSQIVRENIGKTVRVGLSPAGTIIVAAEELNGKRRFVEGVDLGKIGSANSGVPDAQESEGMEEFSGANRSAEVWARIRGETPATSSSPQEMTPTKDYCSRATGLSQGFAEMVAKRLKVSVDSVRLIRAEPQRVSGCIITVDTPVGPQSCQGGTVYYDGTEYWIGGYCS